jgi:hypothetical protein
MKPAFAPRRSVRKFPVEFHEIPAYYFVADYRLQRDKRMEGSPQMDFFLTA